MLGLNLHPHPAQPVAVPATPFFLYQVPCCWAHADFTEHTWLVMVLPMLADMQCALLANSAGIGGGPFYVPLLNVVLEFDLKAATALSHTIVGKLQACTAHALHTAIPPCRPTSH